VNQLDSELLVELGQWLRPESDCVISDNFTRAAESRDEVLQESNDYLVGSAPGRDSLNPLGKEIGSSQDPPVLPTGSRVNFSNEI
jgi:hypothetical protein